MKPFSFLFAGVLLGGLALPAGATPISLGFDKNTVLPGDQLVVTLSDASLDAPADAFTVTVLFDPARLQFSSVAVGAPLQSPGFDVTPGVPQAGSFDVSWIGTQTLPAGLAADLLVLTFKVLDNAPAGLANVTVGCGIDTQAFCIDYDIPTLSGDVTVRRNTTLPEPSPLLLGAAVMLAYGCVRTRRH